jgi:hypothetical protein
MIERVRQHPVIVTIDQCYSEQTDLRAEHRLQNSNDRKSIFGPFLDMDIPVIKSNDGNHVC